MTDPVTTIEPLLTPIRTRLQAATRGPWRAITTGRVGGDHWYVCDSGQSIASIHASDGEDEEQREPDAVFIASAPTDISKLLGAVEAVLSMADGWEVRGEHDMAFSKTVPDEDIAMALLTEGASMVENARKIRNAVTDALEGEGK